LGYSLDVFHRIPVWQHIKLGNADGRVVPSFGEEEISLLKYLAELRIDGRLPDSVVVSILGLTMRTQYRELMGDLVDVRCDQIARVSVARHQQ
jgi:hypothetical protein